MEFLHPAMWHDHWFRHVTATCSVACGSGIHQVAALCNVTRSSGIMTLNLPGGSILQCGRLAGGSGMTCHWIRPNVRHIGILHLVSISTTSPQSTCHCAPVSEILSKSDHPRQKKMTSCRSSIWRISAILDFRDPIMGSLKSQCATSYRWSMDTVALNCLVFLRKSRFLHFGDKWLSNYQIMIINVMIVRSKNRWTAPIH